jgi:hypothetical protein
MRVSIGVDSTKSLSRIDPESESTCSDFARIVMQRGKHNVSCVCLREESNPVSFLLSSDWIMVEKRPTMVDDGFIYWEAGGVIHVCLI